MRPAAAGGIGSSSTFLRIFGTPAGAGKPTALARRKGSADTYFGQPIRWTLSSCRPQVTSLHLYGVCKQTNALKPEASGAMVGYYLNQNALAKASFTGLYSRK